MKLLVTGSAGHLGEALVRSLRALGHDVVGLDIRESTFTNVVGSISDRVCVRRCMRGVGAVLHTATLHKPHIATHRMGEFVDTNITGTLVLLEEAKAADVGPFVFTSTTSVFGDALKPAAGEPAVWVTEEVIPKPKNIYGVTKTSAEDLCQLFFKKYGLATIILRTSRFFPEEDDDPKARSAYEDANLKANEYLFRRVNLEDVVQAHVLALQKAKIIGFDKFIISATTPFAKEDLAILNETAPSVVARYFPGYEMVYEKLGWKMFPRIGRVYINEKARRLLDWRPVYDFGQLIACLRSGKESNSAIAREVGVKGYHDQKFTEGPYPVE